MYSNSTIELWQAIRELEYQNWQLRQFLINVESWLYNYERRIEALESAGLPLSEDTELCILREQGREFVAQVEIDAAMVEAEQALQDRGKDGP